MLQYAPAQTLEIYTVDVEGGKAVLTVSPTAESMLVDLGWPASPERTASTADLSKIDYLVVSHVISITSVMSGRWWMLSLWDASSITETFTRDV